MRLPLRPATWPASRLRSRLYKALVVASLLLCIASVECWVVSHYRGFFVGVCRYHESGALRNILSFEAYEGRVRLGLGCYNDKNVWKDQRLLWLSSFDPASRRPADLTRTPVTLANRLGFDSASYVFATFQWSGFTTPFWSIAGLTALVPAIALTRRIIARRRWSMRSKPRPRSR